MVARLFMLLMAVAALAVPAPGAAATPLFGLGVEQPRVEFGKPFLLELHTRDRQPQLDTLDLAPLRRDFVVETQDSVSRDASGRQSWRIRLYARRPGALTLPPLTFDGVSTPPLKLTATAAVAGRHPLRVSSEVGGTDVWVNQPVMVLLQVESGDPFASLITSVPQVEGVEIVPLRRPARSVVADGAQRSRQSVGWLLYPQTAGRFAIQLPPVDFQSDGIVTHRFYPPRVVLHARPLPAFVPPTMPVGRMELEAALPAWPLLLQRQLAFLTLRVHSDGPPGRYPYEVLRQLRSGRAITFYPPRQIPGAGSGQEGLGSEQTFRVPFAPNGIGVIALPPVRLQYFDPGTGKIVTNTLRPGSFLAVAWWMVVLAAALLLPGALLALRSLWRWLRQQWRTYRGYCRALDGLEQAGTPDALKAALMEIAEAESWPANLTLAAWRHRWLMRYPRLTATAHGVHRLEQWLYGGSAAAVNEIRPCLVAACYRRVPLLLLRSALRRGV